MGHNYCLMLQTSLELIVLAGKSQKVILPVTLLDVRLLRNKRKVQNDLWFYVGRKIESANNVQICRWTKKKFPTDVSRPVLGVVLVYLSSLSFRLTPVTRSSAAARSIQRPTDGRDFNHSKRGSIHIVSSVTRPSVVRWRPFRLCLSRVFNRKQTERNPFPH